ISILIMIWLERGRKQEVPDSRWFSTLTGVAGGFTSMIGNLATSVVAIYLLSMRLPKNAFIGTTAWFFLVINWFKVPFHIFSWHTISLNSFLLDLVTLPLIALGAFLGIVIVKKIRDRAYRWFIIAMTIVAAVFMLL
ncbi:MAG TPA: sulfite exporter TauE/SafE family protein, partial [Chryseosolibacter sp.]|nr:sulfite exporter TauE/SafE family protein [Chryseosolibacter sp.]